MFMIRNLCSLQTSHIAIRTDFFTLYYHVDVTEDMSAKNQLTSKQSFCRKADANRATDYKISIKYTYEV